MPRFGDHSRSNRASSSFRNYGDTFGEVTPDLHFPNHDLAPVVLHCTGVDVPVMSQKDVSRGPWKKNGALHSVIRVSVSGGNLRVFENLAQIWTASQSSGAIIGGCWPG